MGVHTCPHTFVATRAAVQVDEHELLSLDQPQFLETLRLDHLAAFIPNRLTQYSLVAFQAGGNFFLQLVADNCRSCQQTSKSGLRNPDQLNSARILAGTVFLRVPIGDARGRAWSRSDQAHFTNEVTAG